MKRVLLLHCSNRSDQSQQRFVGLRFLVFATVIVSWSAQAGEPGIYESMADIDIGRVFLTPLQRDQLDVQRLRTESGLPSLAAAGAKKPPDRDSKTAAGYITSSRGTYHEWSGNDFVVSQRPLPETRIFPGDVDVQRHASTLLDGGAVEREDAEEENDSDAGD